MKAYAPVATGARPGFTNTRPVFVIDDLRDLRGPAAGTVSLPLYLDWSETSTYDLSEPHRVRTLYATVLREAMSEEDLAQFLDVDVLTSVWGELNLPAFVRAAWEEAHPELRWH